MSILNQICPHCNKRNGFESLFAARLKEKGFHYDVFMSCLDCNKSIIVRVNSRRGVKTSPHDLRENLSKSFSIKNIWPSVDIETEKGFLIVLKVALYRQRKV